MNDRKDLVGKCCVPAATPFDRIVERFLGDDFGGLLVPLTRGYRAPLTEFHRDETGYTATVDMPGLTKDDIEVHIDENDGLLQITGAQSAQIEDKEKGFRSESIRSYRQIVALPEDVDFTKEPFLRYENGVLEVRLAHIPKLADARVKTYRLK